MYLYGFSPRHWDDHFKVELRLESEPNGQELVRLGERWGRFVERIGASEWQVRFAREYVLLEFEPRSRHALTSLRGFLDSTMPRVLEALHVSATETDESLREDLAPGPDFPGSLRVADQELPALSKRDEFEQGAARAEAVKAAKQSEAESDAWGQLLATSIDGIGFVNSVRPDQPPPPAWLEGELFEITESRKIGTPTFWFSQRSTGPTLHESFQDHPLPEGLCIPHGGVVATRADRAVLLVCEKLPPGLASRQNTLVVLSATGAVRRLFRFADDDKHTAFDWVDDRHVAVLSGKKLQIVDVDTGEVVAKASRSGWNVVANDQAIAVQGRTLAIYAWGSGKLAKKATLKIEATIAGRHGNDLLVQLGEALARLTGLDAK